MLLKSICSPFAVSTVRYTHIFKIDANGSETFALQVQVSATNTAPEDYGRPKRSSGIYVSEAAPFFKKLMYVQWQWQKLTLARSFPVFRRILLICSKAAPQTKFNA